MLTGRWGRGQLAVVAALSALMILLAVAPFGGAAATAANRKPGQGPSTTTAKTTIPPIRAVPLAITDGQSVQGLLSRALALDSVGVDTSGVRSAIGIIQQQLDQHAVSVRHLRQVAARADQRATALFAQAQNAARAYASLDKGLKQAVLLLYMNGASGLTVNPDAGPALAYAIPYADTALTPNGILVTRSHDAEREKQALAEARKAAAAANRAEAAVTAEVASEQSEQARLVVEFSSRLARPAGQVGAGPSGQISAEMASEIAADQAAVASQAGFELLSANSLQFSPKGGIPPPLPTTPVALAWAFAELGKPYAWGASGPNAFDCSGLTQFVWRQAGVQIPRVAAAQYEWTIPVPLSQLLPGDLVFYGKTDIHHVGIYIGDGLMINAPYTGTVVQVSSIWWSDLAGFGRVHYPGTPVPFHLPPNLSHPAAPQVMATPGPVPSQKKPPRGWKPKPGSSTPLGAYPGRPGRPAPPTTVPRPVPTTSAPSPTSTPALTTPTTAPPTTATPTTTTPPPPTSVTGSTTSTSTTTTSILPGGSQPP